MGNFPVCMAKTQYSLSDDASKLGRPTGFTVNVREVYVSAGAGFVVAITGSIMTMPGLPKVPAANNIDVTNDCVGFLLIIIGVLPMINRNSRFKKSGIVAIVGFIASVIAQIINFIDWQEAAGSMLTISLGITVIFAIYFTYYFTEALIMESNIQEKSAVTRNYQMTWLILSAAVFAHFMIFGSTISLYSILVEALVGICALYYCFTVYSSSKQLYED